MTALPPSTRVLIAGGGPVGLATAVELGRRGVHCVVIEPRESVSRARPRCKTINVRTMEHLRRWGLADRLRELAPLPVDWSQDIVFCTTLAGRELSRFTGVLGLADGGDRYPERGQQAPQYVLEELLRDTVAGLGPCTLATGWSVASLDRKPDEVQVGVVDRAGRSTVVTADYVVGADGPRSVVREQIGSAYVGEHALRPNFGMVFRAPDLWRHVAHGPAVQYWTVDPGAPGILGPLDRQGTWWFIAFGVDRETGSRDATQLVHAATGTECDVEILSTDPWTARMQRVDRLRAGRVFLAGDAAHLNPPFGGHGLNTGIGDAVDLGWKLAAHLDGWGGPALLDSYEAERGPLQDRVIAEATANMQVLSTDLVGTDLDADGPAADRARAALHSRIQQTKHAEFHALDLVLDTGYDGSPVLARHEEPCPDLLGHRLPHTWLGDGVSIYDRLGPELTLLRLGGPGTAAHALLAAADRRAVPLTVVDLADRGLRDRYGTDLVLVRPDQHVAWAGDEAAGDILDLVRGI
ncbi:FAD-dependent oxidoreductase [Pseudonocardia halophobica]|uniref:Monooxygenase n=1 Tax=Pseudonocardia halophobica TaxID=29401 RepID=A0A9W6NZR8_9PSEU|nr:FAD-dependent monooxygenase [Pseudonocardia halophobica]GLL15181.1 monooxygenase [Pseudonocardia halophobica]